MLEAKVIPDGNSIVCMDGAGCGSLGRDEMGLCVLVPTG